MNIFPRPIRLFVKKSIITKVKRYLRKIFLKNAHNRIVITCEKLCMICSFHRMHHQFLLFPMKFRQHICYCSIIEKKREYTIRFFLSRIRSNNFHRTEFICTYFSLVKAYNVVYAIKSNKINKNYV